MSRGGTPALVALKRSGVAFTIREYDPVEAEGSYGEAVARAIGVDPARLFKTLVAEVDGLPAVAIVPTDRQLVLKSLASAARGKRARMAERADAGRWTGYVTGGISPFGQKRRMPMFVDASVASHPTVCVSGGRRGLQIELAPDALTEASGAEVVEDLAG